MDDEPINALAPRGQQGMLNALWDARPWQGYAQNPPSMLPQLGVALGLLHPRLGGAMRDMGMATQMAKQGGVSALPPGQGPTGSSGATMLSNPTGTSFYPPRGNPLAGSDGVPGGFQATNGTMPGQGWSGMAGNAANVNNRANMQPNLSPVQSQQPQAAAQSPYRPGSRVAQYEAHLANLERQGVPYEQFPTWQAFFRGVE